MSTEHKEQNHFFNRKTFEVQTTTLDLSSNFGKVKFYEDPKKAEIILRNNLDHQQTISIEDLLTEATVAAIGLYNSCINHDISGIPVVLLALGIEKIRRRSKNKESEIEAELESVTKLASEE